MTANDGTDAIPEGYVRLRGSERKSPHAATVVGEIDPNEKFAVTVVLRRRTDGPDLPDLEYFGGTPPRSRTRLSHADFTERHGAHPDEMRAIEDFAQRNGLTVKSSHAGRRHVVLEGTAAQFSQAFGVRFQRYEQPPAPQHKPGPPPRARRFRGRDGFIHVPQELADSIVGVFGLDDRPIGGRNGLPGDTPITNYISVAQAASEYNFPLPGAAVAEQTIGIVSAGGGIGYVQSDIDLTFNAAGLSAPTVYPIAVDGVNNLAAQLTTTAAAPAGGSTLTFAATGTVPDGSIAQYTYAGNTYFLQITAVTATTMTAQAWDQATQSWVTGFQTPIPSGTVIYFNLDGETTQDLAIAGLAAPGANLACYFLQDSQMGWVDMTGRVLFPDPGDFPAGVNPLSVLSSSYYISAGDDPDGLSFYGVTTAMIQAISNAFQDAAILQSGPTICIASGDFGSNCGVGSEIGNPTQGDGYAHVQYPASDPWVLGVGGTTLGQYMPSGSSTPQPVEFPWNAPFTDPDYPWGTGGGGVSDYFPVPSYQSAAGIPDSINPGITSPHPSTVTPPAPFNTTGRGVPDVAANANYRTGFSGIAFGGVPGGQVGNGTSASAPFWAGLIAVLNSNAGFNIAFANPTLYALGPAVFNPINPLWRDPAYPQLATAPVDNSNSGIPGYPTHAGWDAVTGLGSPNGMAILSGLQGLERVYILGGYQSPDVILTDLSTGQPVPIGGRPSGPWDTQLAPSTNYGFSANVHNDGSTPANGVVVTFWAIPGGVGTSGSMVGAPQTVNIPARSTLTVNASAPFTSAPSGGHLCAVVSLYSPATGCTVDATTATQIPNPGYSLTHECSAWRNTDSMFALVGGGFRFGLGLGTLPYRLERPIILAITARHVPAQIEKTPALTKVADTLRAVGAKSNQALYLLPGVLQAMGTVDLRHTVKAVHGVEVKPGENGEWLVLPEREHEKAQLEITGHVPATVKEGDVLLVRVSANYPRVVRHAARTVEFLEFVYVTDKER
jgi:hypothetical protein